MTKRFEFSLALSAEQYLAYYQGAASKVVVRCTNGQSIQFPARLLTRFVTHQGIQGQFVLTCSDDMKGSTLHRRGTPG
jgi:predicted flavoprotein YhiN